MPPPSSSVGALALAAWRAKLVRSRAGIVALALALVVVLGCLELNWVRSPLATTFSLRAAGAGRGKDAVQPAQSFYELCNSNALFNATCCDANGSARAHASYAPLRAAAAAAAAAEAETRGTAKAQNGTAEPSKGQLPRRGRVAVLLRGGSFRAGGQRGRPCQPTAVANQTRATRSLLEKIIAPLEDLGNVVDVFITDRPCHLQPIYLEMYGARLVANETYFSFGQWDNIRIAMDLFKQKSGGVHTIAKTYDLVLLTRHDIVWQAAVDAWPADWSMFNFASPCELCTKGLPIEECVHDILHVMPGHLYPAFDSEVGTWRCFSPHCGGGCAYWQVKTGHACYSQIANAIGVARTGFASDYVPSSNVREPNDFAVLY